MSSKVHFFNLDVLRFICVFMVVFCHGYEEWSAWFGVGAYLKNPDSGISLWIKETLVNYAANFGYLGVEFFFFISGFLITYLLIKEKQEVGKINVGKFYVRRMLRIWPLCYLVVAVAYFWLEGYLQKGHPHYLSVMLFYYNYEAIYHGTLIYPFPHFWSICVEEHFYLFWPLLLYAVSFRKLPYLFGAIVLLSIGARFYYYHTPDAYAHMLYNTLCRIDAMAIGGAVAYIHYIKPITFRIHSLVRLAVYVFFFALLGYEIVFRDQTLVEAVFKKYIYLGFIIFWFCNYMFGTTAWANFKRKNILHYLGKISFGIYILHNVLLKYIIVKWVVEKNNYSYSRYWLIYLGATIVVSVISYELFEKRFLKLKEKFELIKTQR